MWRSKARSDGRPYHRQVTDQGRSPGAGPSVCPFVALAEDRDRRADSPDEGNRCYAERAPRQRDMVYQADYCYSEGFAQCSVFLGWAARNAAEPAYVAEVAQKAWGSGITAPEAEEAALAGMSDDQDTAPEPTPETGLFGPADVNDAAGAKSGSEQLDWVSASAWAEAPWDERAEMEADEIETLADDEPEEDPDEESEEDPDEEATQVPKVPAAVPVRRRKRAQPVIRSRGSGEWFYADPPGSEPLVTRRRGVTPPILLAVLGLLVVALVVFLIPTLFFGGGDGQTAAAPSPSPLASQRPAVTRAPAVATTAPSAAPSASPTPRPATHRVRRNDTLTSIALTYGVKPQHIQCLNGILNKNIVMLGAVYDIPPDGFTCPPGWRNAN